MYSTFSHQELINMLFVFEILLLYVGAYILMFSLFTRSDYSDSNNYNLKEKLVVYTSFTIGSILLFLGIYLLLHIKEIL